MRNSQRGFFEPLILILVAVLLVGGGAYAYLQNKQTNPIVGTDKSDQAAQQTKPTNPIKAASFTASPTSGPAPLTVNFTGDWSSISSLGLRINYGDGETDFLCNPGERCSQGAHIYKKEGTFTATLVSGPVGSQGKVIKTATVSVTDTHATASSIIKETNEPAISCGNGDDYYDGGEGADTLSYTGKRSEFIISKNNDDTYTFKDTVPCRAETDTVINIEYFDFADGLYTPDTLHPEFINGVKSNFVVATTAAPTLDLSVSTTSTPVGGTATISWYAKNTVRCTMYKSGGTASDVKDVDMVGTTTLQLSKSQTFIFTCGGPGGFLTKMIPVNITSR